VSGIDEQSTDVKPCGCEEFMFWIINGLYVRIGFLNPDAWVDSDMIRSVNRRTSVMGLSKDKFINEIASFHCDSCGRVVVRGNNIFERLCTDVRRRWNIGESFLPDGDE